VTFGERYQVPRLDEAQQGEEKGRKADLALIRKQADLVVEQLRGEGREVAAGIVEELDGQLATLASDLRDAREELAELKAGTKSSRGKDRASAAGTISRGGKAQHGQSTNEVSYAGYARAGGIAPPHKHDYGSDGRCIKVTQGIACASTRQRASRKSRQTTISGATDNGAAKAPATETSP
jgi:hypothetical protein